MKFFTRWALVVGSCTLAFAGIASAQDEMGQRASVFDLGIYAGGAYHTDWFETPGPGDEDVGWGPGLAPVFGAHATYWTSPTFGIRFGAGFSPASLAPDDVDGLPDDFAVNNWFYDLDLLFRPWVQSPIAGLPADSYLFAGPSFVRSSPDNGNTEDGFGINFGVGSDLFPPFGPSLTPFAELSGRVYQAPFDGGDSRMVFGAEFVVGVELPVR